MDQSMWNTAAAEQGDSSSTEDVESPRSVVAAAAVAAARRGTGRWRRWRNRNMSKKEDEKEKEKAAAAAEYVLHSQVLRIKEEELQISEDLIGDYCSNYDCCYLIDDNNWSKTNLPASPLSKRT